MSEDVEGGAPTEERVEVAVARDLGVAHVELGLPMGEDVVAEPSPVAIEKGSRFAIREGGRTVGAGTITEILA